MNDETASNTEQEKPNTEAHHELLRRLFRELAAAERSARRDGRREAERLGSTPPAEALRAVAEHSNRVQHDIAELVRRADLRSGRVGTLLGESFAVVRELIADRLVDAERSYRVTLLGLRHGTDLVDLIRRVADASGQVEIGGFCTRWLEERGPLVERIAHELAWFARYPERAAELPGPRVVARLVGAGRRRPTGESRAHAAG